MVVLKVVGFMALMPVLLFALVLDPGVIVVLEDGTWLEVVNFLD